MPVLLKYLSAPPRHVWFEELVRVADHSVNADHFITFATYCRSARRLIVPKGKGHFANLGAIRESFDARKNECMVFLDLQRPEL